MKNTKTAKQEPTKATSSTGTTIPSTPTVTTDVGTGPATQSKSTTTTNKDSDSLAKSISKNILGDPRFVSDLADKISNKEKK